MTDMYGNEIIDNGDGSYTRGGVTVYQDSPEAAIITFNGMIPEEKQEEGSPDDLS